MQVENLFRIYHDMRSSRIKKRRLSQRKKELAKKEEDGGDEQADNSSVGTPDERVPSESDAG